jgi:hypothetical protein
LQQGQGRLGIEPRIGSEPHTEQIGFLLVTAAHPQGGEMTKEARHVSTARSKEHSGGPCRQADQQVLAQSSLTMLTEAVRHFMTYDERQLVIGGP